MANSHTTRQGDFIWYELMTGDADSAQAFYGPLLGWEFSGGDTSGMDYRHFSKDGVMIGGVLPLTHGMIDSGIRPQWAGYIAVDDVDASLAAITGKGGTVLMEPRQIPGAGRFALVTDLDGAPFYIMTSEPAGGSSASFARYAPQDGHCAWNELATSDPSAAETFYTSLFGWEKADTMDMGEMGTYAMYRNGDYTLGAMMAKPAEMPVSLWSYYFRVQRIAAAVEYVAEQGGRILNGPMEIPGGDRVVTGIDPQGAMFSLIGQAE